MTFPFRRDSGNGMVVVVVELDKLQKMTVILDTGASISTFDLTEMVMAGYDLSNPVGRTKIETGNGVVETQVYELQEIAAFGIVRKHFQIQVYDFLAHGMVADYQGMLGMDFFEGTKFCIDTVQNQISIEPLPV